MPKTGARGAPAGSAAGGLATVAETDCVNVASASPSSSPAVTRLLQEQNLLDGAAQQLLQQQHMLAAQAQVAQLFGGPGGLQQAQAALQAHASLFGGNGGPPAPLPSTDLSSVLTTLTNIEGRLTTSLGALDARIQPLEAGLAARSNQAAQNASQTSPASASSGLRRPASPAASDAGSDSLSRASTDDAAASIPSWGSPPRTSRTTSTNVVSSVHGSSLSRARDLRC